ncbi:MAG: hypothetical protein LBK69_04065 [Syntrophomonadaceae bacterium]|jgi:hypothetical protein|nr:hypothetical protein [Syntrophomonadaceae bacterium]
MMRREQERKQTLYKETAGVVMSWFNKSKINAEEMKLLLNLLEEIMTNKHFPQLTKSLREWQNSAIDQGAEEIIMATLMAADFKKPEEIVSIIVMIDDFLAESGEYT